MENNNVEGENNGGEVRRYQSGRELYRSGGKDGRKIYYKVEWEMELEADVEWRKKGGRNGR